MASNSKVTSLALLRGIAVLAVCFCHFGKPVATGEVLPGLFKTVGEYGKYGVNIFFVISGFVIPFSLYKAKYEIKDYFLFLYKRFLRLHPPYIVGLVLTLIMAAASYHARHIPNPETPLSIFKSLFYLHAPQDNPVFWTLRIEAEYYIFIGLFFVLLTKFPKAALVIGIPLLAVLTRTPVTAYSGLLTFLTPFLIGMTGYLIYVKGSNTIMEYAVLAALIIFSFVFEELAASIAATLTIICILYFRRPVSHIVEFPGEISYSLYLIHFPLGIKLINLLQKHLNPSLNWLVFLIATGVCFLFAYIFWKLIEKPSAKLSNKVKYGKTTPEFKNFSLKPE